MKNYLLGAVAAVAVLSCGTLASAKPVQKPYSVLWNQNDNFGYGVNSQNYEAALAADDDIAADDFTIPPGQTWYISEVDVTGAYVNGSGPASSEIVTFWKGPNGRAPSKIAGHGAYQFTMNCTDNSGSFSCILPNNAKGRKALVKLKSGTYWLTMVANCDSITCGEWEWTTNTTVQGFYALYKNPGRGDHTGCSGWGILSACFGPPGADLAWDLIGTL